MAKNSKVGRPAHKPTTVTRRKVTNAAACGMSHEEIAIGLGIHRHTLDKYYETELSTGALGRRMEVFDAMVTTAKKGNVSAQKAVLAMTPGAAAPPVPKDKPLGKKDQANADAKTAADGTDWNDLLPGNVTPLRRTA